MARKSDDETRARDQQILNRLANIEHKVDSMDQTQAFALRAEADKHAKSVMAIFGRSKRRAQIYLAATGQRNVNGIASHLSIKPPNVSTDLRRLLDEGLLEIVSTAGNSDIWGKKALDRTLRVSKLLCEKFDLDKDGKPRPKTKSR